MKGDSYPVFYLVVYRNMRKMAKGSRFITHSTLLEVLGRILFRIPKVLYCPIIKDLEKYKLLKKIDRKKYELVGGNVDSLLNQYNCPV